MRTLILSLSLIVATSQAFAQKAAPDGFGPIKFGMTYEEAWAAINGQGKWIERENRGRRLEYDITNVGKGSFSVEQTFVNEKAAGQLVTPALPAWFPRCLSRVAEVVSDISNIYGKTPIISSVDDPKAGWKTATLYVFSFPNSSSIVITSILTSDPTLDAESPQSRTQLRCEAFLRYNPPSLRDPNFPY